MTLAARVEEEAEGSGQRAGTQAGNDGGWTGEGRQERSG